MEKTATISPCGKYRYDLTRKWGDGPTCAFVGLNPSTADATEDDPTIRRCIGFAQSWGYGQLVMLNAYAYRATDPKVMQRAADPIGPDNDWTLRTWWSKCTVIVAAWGAHIDVQYEKELLQRYSPWHFLRVTKTGHPGHPLYLPKHLTPQRWRV